MTKDGNFELIFETCNGDEVFRDESNVVVRFAQKRNGIVTSWINAGYREDLEAVFNHQLSQETLDGEESEEINISDYLKGLSHELAVSLDLDENRISGLVTSAKMTNVGISTERFRKLEVTAISTAALMSMQVLQAILQVITMKTAILIWISFKLLVMGIKTLLIKVIFPKSQAP